MYVRILFSVICPDLCFGKRKSLRQQKEKKKENWDLFRASFFPGQSIIEKDFFFLLKYFLDDQFFEWPNFNSSIKQFFGFLNNEKWSRILSRRGYLYSSLLWFWEQWSKVTINQGIRIEKSPNINYLSRGGDINISDRVKKVYSELIMTIELSRKFPSLLIELWFTISHSVPF